MSKTELELLKSVLAALREARDTGLCPMSRDEMILALSKIEKSAERK